MTQNAGFATVVLLLVIALLLGPAARADLRAGERCEGQKLSFLQCVSAGLRWQIVGGPGDDELIGTSFDDVIHSGRGVDVVDGGRGSDECYVQPVDVVRGCEVLK